MTKTNARLKNLTTLSSLAFQHLPPNTARIGYATEGALILISVQLSAEGALILISVQLSTEGALILISVQLSADAVSAL